MIEEAKTQYNDFKGTVAADGIDPHHSNILAQYLKDKGVDTNIYKPIGFDISNGRNGYCYFYIICIKENKKIVNVGFEKKQSWEEVLDLFKRFNVVASLSGEKYDNLISDSDIVWIDDREED